MFNRQPCRSQGLTKTQLRTTAKKSTFGIILINRLIMTMTATDHTLRSHISSIPNLPVVPLESQAAMDMGGEDLARAKVVASTARRLIFNLSRLVPPPAGAPTGVDIKPNWSVHSSS